MTQYEKQLWEKIYNFPIDEKDAAFTFSARLSRENGWNRNYTLRVIDEYKKFIFLCCISPTPVTPSDPVDQVWHLHLTYTRSYWIDFCKDTLNQEIHHNPTKGGSIEKQKFNDCYTSLQDIYREKFGQLPPIDIWQDNKTRFSQINFRRIDLQKYWLVKKPAFRARVLLAQMAALFSGGIFIQAEGKGFIIAILTIGFFIALFYNLKNDDGKGGNRSKDSDNVSTCSSDSGSTDSGCSSDSDGGDSGCSGCGGCGGD